MNSFDVSTISPSEIGVLVGTIGYAPTWRFLALGQHLASNFAEGWADKLLFNVVAMEEWVKQPKIMFVLQVSKLGHPKKLQYVFSHRKHYTVVDGNSIFG